jgi:hypothetical protein
LIPIGKSLFIRSFSELHGTRIVSAPKTRSNAIHNDDPLRDLTIDVTAQRQESVLLKFCSLRFVVSGFTEVLKGKGDDRASKSKYEKLEAESDEVVCNRLSRALLLSLRTNESLSHAQRLQSATILSKRADIQITRRRLAPLNPYP